MSRPRRLRDVQTLDEASRGPLGSFKMLLGRVATSTASLGALITIFALAFDPFVQQLIDYPVNPMVMPSANASTRRATFVPDLGNVRGVHFTAVTDAVALGTFSNNFPRNPTCPSRNCTWPSVRSVSWCAKCEDVTGQAEIVDCDPTFDWNISTYSDGESKFSNCRVSLPYFEPIFLLVNATLFGQHQDCDSQRDTCHVISSLDVSGTYQIVSQLLPLRETNTNATRSSSDFDLQHRMVLQMGAIGLTPDFRGPGFSISKVLKCGVSPCLNTYSVSVQDAQEHTRLVDSKLYQSRLRNLTGFSKEISASPLNAATCFELDDAPKNYSRVEPSISTVASYVDTERDSFCIYSWLLPWIDAANYNWASPLDAWVDPIAQAISATVSVNSTVFFNDSSPVLSAVFDPETDSASYIEHILYQGGLESVLTNITNSLTNLNLGYSTDTVSGNLVEQVVFIHVRWRWITLPAILVAAAAFSLITAILETRSSGVELWKDSTLALLYHGIDESVIDDQELYSKSRDVDMAAKRVDVQLTRDTDSGRLMLRQQNRPEKA